MKCLFFAAGGSDKGRKKVQKGTVGVRSPYMRVIGIEVETDGRFFK